MKSSPGKKQVMDQAICLTRREFSETSLVVVLLGRHTGKVSLLAKGARRPKSPLAIDLLDIGQAGFIANPEGLGILSSFSTSLALPEMRTDMNTWNVGLYLAELAHLATKDFAPAADLFDLLIDALQRACRARAGAELAHRLVDATTRILHWAGYTPQLDHCVVCRRTLAPTDQLFFSPSQGGAVCRDCEPAIVDKFRIEHRAWYYLLGKVDDPTSAGKAFDVLNLMLREHLGKPPRMHPYCRSLFAD